MPNQTEILAERQVDQFKILIPVMAEHWGIGWRDPNIYQMLVDVYCLGIKVGSDGVMEMMREKLKEVNP